MTAPLPHIPAETLAAYAAGDLSPDRRAALADHLATCSACRQTLAAHGRLETLLPSLLSGPISEATRERVRTNLATALAPAAPPEIMTVAEVAAYLRLAPEDLDEILPDLHAFEVAGQLRVRRERLLEWIAARERQFARAVLQAQTAQMLRLALAQGAAS